MLRGCKDEAETQQLKNVIMVDAEAQASELSEDDDLPDWMKQASAIPAWFGGENSDQARASFAKMIPKQST